MSLGPMELALILGITLLLFGPSRLPGLGKSLGESIRGFKKGIEGEETPAPAPPRAEQISAAPVAPLQSDLSKNKTEV